MQRFAVIGLGRFGEHLAKALTASGDEVIGIDREADLVDRVRDEVAVAVRLDGTDRAALEAQGVGEVDAAIVGIGEDFESSALTVAALKELGVARIVARAMTPTQASILKKVGADEIAYAEQESALRWAHRLTLPNLKQYVDLGEDHALVYMSAPASLCGQSLADLELRKKYGVNVVAVQRGALNKGGSARRSGKSDVFSVPTPDTVIRSGDVLIVVGSSENLSGLPVD